MLFCLRSCMLGLALKHLHLSPEASLHLRGGGSCSPDLGGQLPLSFLRERQLPLGRLQLFLSRGRRPLGLLQVLPHCHQLLRGDAGRSGHLIPQLSDLALVGVLQV